MNVSQNEKKDCCGCGLCEKICPVAAITMEEDNLGFSYPSVNKGKCIECGKCCDNCIITNPIELKNPILCYAAARKDKDKLKLSSSGGVFASIAESLIDSGKWGISGCVLDDSFLAKQKLVFNNENIKDMYGSKYVQCSMDNIYKEILDALQLGKKILFSGTPCQVAAIKKYTGDHINLYTIEVICHGVSNNQMFVSYLEMYDKDNIERFVFRDKSQGWTYNNKIIYVGKKEKKVNHRMSSYMTYYLDGEIYRESCYSCPYACGSRGADITVGDFWGIIRKRPELKQVFDIERGISCLLVNSEKGKKILEKADIVYEYVSYEDIREGNEPLKCPSSHSDKRNEILKLWKERLNWRDVDGYWRAHDYSLAGHIWSKLPASIQHRIRILLNKR
ncbi:Coenzyme F420 hydrogenase/dehydrogenase, beta subunit C-terminal domain [Eubacterium sp. MSJ-33]|uniref:Coenzyme F420 hydrogenase/dehydrogenase, beta subunit C-terminal domain n=1 Tax=Eubacterium sp. MSJ-33 TaxID=2841528 RepID=UPI001C78BC9E|nr:Coenzyme F420 hydrogenase/dehydrogenase, beta subunit C-terminal domain [Eubacterium sp. MSJ-33]QWT54150.1 Coenzyme F420 hydrogenase/dehydrogenase, beta subunit C-terminal domain [Eubacterium sp. MSJ-33]